MPLLCTILLLLQELNIHYVDVTSTDESKRRKLRIKEEDEDDNDINDAAMDMYR
jgi:hypothetical protein